MQIASAIKSKFFNFWLLITLFCILSREEMRFDKRPRDRETLEVPARHIASKILHNSRWRKVTRKTAILSEKFTTWPGFSFDLPLPPKCKDATRSIEASLHSQRLRIVPRVRFIILGEEKKRSGSEEEIINIKYEILKRICMLIFY